MVQTRLCDDSTVPHPPRRRFDLFEPLQPTGMREVNLASLLRAVRRLGPQARVELAAQTGISPATVTKLVASLTDVHILQELANTRTERSTGRPRVPVDFVPGGRVVLALHLGARTFVAAAVDLRGHELGRVEKPYDSSTPEEAIGGACQVLSELRVSHESHARTVGIGITSGGSVDHRGGILHSHPILPWRNVAVRRIVVDQLQLPCEYDETVRGFALHEQQLKRWGSETVLHVFVGRAVQSALLIDGRLHRGFDSRAGTLDHWPVPGVHGPECSCGQTNCFGKVASNDGIAWLARDRGLIDPGAGYDEVLAAAAAGDRALGALLRQRARWIGRMVAAAADLIDPSVVLISGTAHQTEGFTDEVAEALNRAGSPIDPARLRYSPDPFDTVAAASALFLDVYFDDPVYFEPGLQRRLPD